MQYQQSLEILGPLGLELEGGNEDGPLDVQASEKFFVSEA